MTNDDFLDRLRQEWTGGGIDIERLRLATIRRKRRAALRLAVEGVGAIVAVVVAVWFTVLAIQTGRSAFWLAVTAMVLVAPAMAVNWMHARRDARADYGSSAIGVLNQAMAQARSELRLASGGRYAVVILLLCAAVVWVLHLFSLETRRDAALLSAVWAGTALLAWIRLRQRERVLRAELESYEHHAQELGRDET